MPTTTVRRDAENLQSSGQGPPVEVRVGSSLSCLRDGSDSTYVQVSFSDINADEQGYFDADIAGIGSGIVIESIVMNLRAAGYAPETEISGFPNRAPFYLELYGTTGDTYAHWYVYMPDDASLTPVS